jgi:phage terminase small subunit
MAKLTAKQKLFCNEYLIDTNATQAAIRSGYSNSYANKKAFLLLDIPHIKAYIDKRMKDREKRTEITQDRVLQEFAKIAFANTTDYVEVKDMGQYKMVSVKPTEGMTADQVVAIASIKQGANGIEIKLHDKVKALEDIGRHLGMFKDKLEVSGNINNPFNDLSTDDLKRLINDG